MGVVVSATSRPLCLQKRDPVSIAQEAQWTPEPVWTDAEKFAPSGIRFPDRPARSGSLYRLRYPGSHCLMIEFNNTLLVSPV
jgi:hypothetical protein